MELEELRKGIMRAINIDELIELVKERPVLWDKTVVYRTKEYCTSQWSEICKTLFNIQYDSWDQQQKAVVRKVVRQKWTTARDIWQRTHKKRKEGLQNGEHFNDGKDVRYEKLKFLTKVYDKMDHFQSGNEEIIINKNPPSPQGEGHYDADINRKTIDFQRDLLKLLYTGNQSPKMTPLQKRPEENVESSSQNRIEQGSSSHKPVVVDFDDKLKVGSFLSATKHRSSSVDNRDGGLSTCKPKQSPKHEQTTDPFKNRTSSYSNQNLPLSNPDPQNNQIPKNNPHQSPLRINTSKNNLDQLLSRSNFPRNNPVQSPSKDSLPKNNPGQSPSINDLPHNNSDQRSQKVEERSPVIKEEYISIPSISSDTNTNPAKQNVAKRKHSETTVEQTPRKRIAQDENSSNTQLEDFLKVIKPQIEDFNKSQIMEFFFDILKPLIKDLDKHQYLDFQIEALQLIKRIGGSQAT